MKIEQLANKTEELFHVLMRDEDVSRKANFKFEFEPHNHKEKVVEYIKSSFPGEYNAALNLVNDPNRKVVQIYDDEVKHFAEKYESLEWEINDYINLFNLYLDERNVRDDFTEFLKDLKKEVDKSGESYWGNINEHLRNFSE